jgi:hypothetical protein
MTANIPPRKDINHGMVAPKPAAPAGPHITQPVRERPSTTSFPKLPRMCARWPIRNDGCPSPPHRRTERDVMTTAHTARRDTAIPSSPPPGWERETPKYRVMRDTQPAQKARFRFEPPFASCMDSDVWQYGEKPLKAGEIVETTAWPHPSFFPLNYGAKKVLEFFRASPKSRMQRSPWAGDQIRLDDGLAGNIVVQATPPQLQPMDLRPAS